MYTILNQYGEKIAYIQNMMIVDLSGETVLGIIIGDCFFGKTNSVVGKIFNQTAYLINGEIVGRVIENKDYKTSALRKNQMLAAWDILSNVKEHTSKWIEVSDKWSEKTLLFHLL